MNTINSNTGATYAMKAPDIAADGGKKVELLFPTAEVVRPKIENGAASVDIVREHTVVDLGNLAGDVALTLAVVGPHNPGAAVTLVFEPQGAQSTVTVNGIVVNSSASGDVVVTLPIVDGRLVVPAAAAATATDVDCCKAEKVKTLNDPSKATKIEKERQLLLVNGLDEIEDGDKLYLNSSFSQEFAEVIVAFTSPESAAATLTVDIEGKTVDIEGIAGTTVAKKLVVGKDGDVFVL